MLVVDFGVDRLLTITPTNQQTIHQVLQTAQPIANALIMP
jgi:hypothetical protein